MWVYHKDSQAKIIDSEYYEEAKEGGWEDSPAKLKQQKKQQKK